MKETSRIEEKLADIKEYLNELNGRLPSTFEGYKRADLMLKRTVERNLQLINDSEIDVLAILVKLKELSIAVSEEALIDRFNKLLSKRVVAHLKEFRRLRNMLTHTYKNENYDELVFDSTKKLDEVRDFIRDVNNLIKDRH
jgi:uncharacterized protein YutE (UPF0331/DUF86 family)